MYVAQIEMRRRVLCYYCIDRKIVLLLVLGPGSYFCETHMAMEQGSSIGDAASAGKGDSSRRVPCPIDPRHSVRAACLASHIKICASNYENTNTVSREGFSGTDPDYYSKNVNAGREDEELQHLHTKQKKTAPEQGKGDARYSDTALWSLAQRLHR